MAEEEDNVLKNMNPSQIAFLITKYWRRPNKYANSDLHYMMDLKEDDKEVYERYIYNSRDWVSPLSEKIVTELKERIKKIDSIKKKPKEENSEHTIGLNDEEVSNLIRRTISLYRNEAIGSRIHSTQETTSPYIPSVSWRERLITNPERDIDNEVR